MENEYSIGDSGNTSDKTTTQQHFKSQIANETPNLSVSLTNLLEDAFVEPMTSGGSKDLTSHSTMNGCLTSQTNANVDNNGPRFHPILPAPSHHSVNVAEKPSATMTSSSSNIQTAGTDTEERLSANISMKMGSLVPFSSAPHPPYSSKLADQTATSESPSTFEGINAIVPRRCSCSKSMCLKLYCECFSQRLLCVNCKCTNCMNDGRHETVRLQAIKNILERNPVAFVPKIRAGQEGLLWRHRKGCTCKRSGCLKNYCECYEAKVCCSELCRCKGCHNTEAANIMRYQRNMMYIDECDQSSSTTEKLPSLTSVSISSGSEFLLKTSWNGNNNSANSHTTTTSSSSSFLPLATTTITVSSHRKRSKVNNGDTLLSNRLTWRKQSPTRTHSNSSEQYSVPQFSGGPGVTPYISMSYYVTPESNMNATANTLQDTCTGGNTPVGLTVPPVFIQDSSGCWVQQGKRNTTSFPSLTAATTVQLQMHSVVNNATAIKTLAGIPFLSSSLATHQTSNTPLSANFTAPYLTSDQQKSVGDVRGPDMVEMICKQLVIRARELERVQSTRENQEGGILWEFGSCIASILDTITAGLEVPSSGVRTSVATVASQFPSSSTSACFYSFIPPANSSPASKVKDNNLLHHMHRPETRLVTPPVVTSHVQKERLPPVYPPSSISNPPHFSSSILQMGSVCPPMLLSCGYYSPRPDPRHLPLASCSNPAPPECRPSIVSSPLDALEPTSSLYGLPSLFFNHRSFSSNSELPSSSGFHDTSSELNSFPPMSANGESLCGMTTSTGSFTEDGW